jgi:hypothetical protein
MEMKAKKERGSYKNTFSSIFSANTTVKLPEKQ